MFWRQRDLVLLACLTLVLTASGAGLLAGLGGVREKDTAKEKPQEALVVAVGNGKVIEDGSLRKLEVKAGDKVLFSKYSGNEIKIDGTEHLIRREDDILAVID